eukprot:1184500-Pleurochrysis_carterae.AAC.2
MRSGQPTYPPSTAPPHLPACTRVLRRQQRTPSAQRCRPQQAAQTAAPASASRSTLRLHRLWAIHSSSPPMYIPEKHALNSAEQAGGCVCCANESAWCSSTSSTRAPAATVDTRRSGIRPLTSGDSTTKPKARCLPTTAKRRATYFSASTCEGAKRTPRVAPPPTPGALTSAVAFPPPSAGLFCPRAAFHGGGNAVVGETEKIGLGVRTPT